MRIGLEFLIAGMAVAIGVLGGLYQERRSLYERSCAYGERVVAQMIVAVNIQRTKGIMHRGIHRELLKIGLLVTRTLQR